MITYIDGDMPRLDRASLLDSVNPEGLLTQKVWANPTVFMASCCLPERPGTQQPLHQGDDFVATLCGDLITDDWPGWPVIHDSLVRSDHGVFQRFKGAFVISVYDIGKQIVWIVNDRLSVCPVYHARRDCGALFATSPGAFLRAPGFDCQFDEEWLYELFFFNYAVNKKTPLRGVRRFAPATVAQFDLPRAELTFSQYLPRLQRSAELESGDAAIERATEVFRTSVPGYVPRRRRAAFSISAGLDSRTLLAALPHDSLQGVETFTYGIEGADELLEAAQVAEALELQHREIHLGRDYLDQLPDLMHDTVRLSGALQGVNRSNLLYVYRALADSGERYPVVVAGVSGDHLFRDHSRGTGNVPYIISRDMMAMFQRGRHPVETPFYRTIFGPRLDAFVARTEEVLDELQENFGDFAAPESYLSYLVYEVTPRYFGGQAAVANTCTTFRTPYWDPEILELVHQIDLGTLGSSYRYRKQQPYLECLLQASVIASNPVVGRIPFRHLPISAFTCASSTRYQFYRLARKVRSTRLWRPRRHFEAWPLWYRTALAEKVRELLGPDCLIRNYVSGAFIERIIDETDIHWLGKLQTAEITLRLVESGWRRAA